MAPLVSALTPGKGGKAEVAVSVSLHPVQPVHGNLSLTKANPL